MNDFLIEPDYVMTDNWGAPYFLLNNVLYIWNQEFGNYCDYHMIKEQSNELPKVIINKNEEIFILYNNTIEIYDSSNELIKEIRNVIDIIYDNATDCYAIISDNYIKFFQGSIWGSESAIQTWYDTEDKKISYFNNMSMSHGFFFMTIENYLMIFKIPHLDIYCPYKTFVNDKHFGNLEYKFRLETNGSITARYDSNNPISFNFCEPVYKNNPALDLQYLQINDNKLKIIYDPNNEILKEIITNISEYSIKLGATIRINTHNYFNIVDIIFNEDILIQTYYNEPFYILRINDRFFLNESEKIFSLSSIGGSINYFDSNNMDEQEIIIDVEMRNNLSEYVYDQLSLILPYLHRANNLDYNFNIIDSYGNVISYGNGVTRQIYTLLWDEIDNKIKNFPQLSDKESFVLGQMIYIMQSSSKTNPSITIHPLFFCFMSYLQNESNDIFHAINCKIILHNYKKNEYQKYIDQLVIDGNSLTHISDEILSVHDFMVYIFRDELTDNEINNILLIARGYHNYFSRNIEYSRYSKLPINILMDHFPDTHGNLFPEFKYLYNYELTNINSIRPFITLIEDMFDKMTETEKEYFVLNITGSKYYDSVININLVESDYYNEFGEKMDNDYELRTCATEFILRIDINNEEETCKKIKMIIEILKSPDYNLIN